MEGVCMYECEEIEGYISYVKAGKKDYLVIGDPICSENDMMRLIHSFRLHVLSQKGRFIFLSISEKTKELFEMMGFGVLKIGEEALFDIPSFSFEGKEKRSFRNMVRRAEKEGVSIRHITRLTQEEQDKIQNLNSDWLINRKTKGFSFLLKLTPFENFEDKIFFVAELGDKIVGYISAVPIYARKGYYFEDIIRSKDAPLGTNQLLIYSIILFMKEQGYAIASLWTSPLWNIEENSNTDYRKTQKILKLLYNRVNSFYNFKWLYHFKKSLCPSFWEEKYIAFYPQKLRPKVFFAIAKAYNPKGVTGIIVSKISKIVFPMRKK